MPEVTKELMKRLWKIRKVTRRGAITIKRAGGDRAPGLGAFRRGGEDRKPDGERPLVRRIDHHQRPEEVVPVAGHGDDGKGGKARQRRAAHRCGGCAEDTPAPSISAASSSSAGMASKACRIRNVPKAEAKNGSIDAGQGVVEAELRHQRQVRHDQQHRHQHRAASGTGRRSASCRRTTSRAKAKPASVTVTN